MTEMPASLHDTKDTHKAWDLVLDKDRPIKKFFIPIGSAPDLDVELYVHNAPGFYHHGVFGGSDEAWTSYLWAKPLPLLAALFPDRQWTPGDVEEMSTHLWCRFFDTTRNKDGAVHDQPDMDTPLFRATHYDMGAYEEHTGNGYLIPCDSHNLPRIIAYVQKQFGYAPRTRQAVADELAKLEGINSQNLADYVAIRAERDGLKDKVKAMSQQTFRQETVYTPLTILYVFCSLMIIGVLLLVHFRS